MIVRDQTTERRSMADLVPFAPAALLVVWALIRSLW